MSDTLDPLRSGQLAGATRLDLACGLREFPREVFDLADTLEILNLSGNQLSALPDDLGRLHRLRILFCSHNAFRHLPEVIGTCPNLSMVGFRANEITQVDDAALSPSLRWLILTENRIETLPAALGRCAQMQKLMLSGNRLADLPEELRACGNLEMLRIASNRIARLPGWLLEMPRLAWLAMAGNPCAAEPAVQDKAVAWSTLHVQEKLGEGASGIIHRASVDGEAVAVKLFKSEVTSDGLASSEIAASLAAGEHPNLVSAHARIGNHPSGTRGLVMPLMDPAFRNLAGPPSFDTCTRDVYADQQTFAPEAVLRIAHGTAHAAAHLHGQGLLHGDLYAHNVLWKEDGHCLLGDLGAAAFYDEHGPQAAALQRVEVRAWGILLEELLQRTAWSPQDAGLRSTLETLATRCLTPEVSARPSFEALCGELRGLGLGK